VRQIFLFKSFSGGAELIRCLPAEASAQAGKTALALVSQIYTALVNSTSIPAFNAI